MLFKPSIVSMDKVTHINMDRVRWCCEQHGMTLSDLGRELSIAEATINLAVEGEPALSIKQLQKIASFFNRGLLFFLEQEPINESSFRSMQFRTITNQKPNLSPKLTALVERVEKHRDLYISLLEDLGDEVSNGWYPKFDVENQATRDLAEKVRNWLGVNIGLTFDVLRESVEAKNILVFVTNGYAGQWQIPKESKIRGFSLYYENYPVVAVRKQLGEGPMAFTLMHELAHLILHRESVIDDEDDFYSYQGKERDANRLAGLILVPDEYLDGIDFDAFPYQDVQAYDSYLKMFSRKWCVSAETILRRMLDNGLLSQDKYQAYRSWKNAIPVGENRQGGGNRVRYKEPVRIFGQPFVRAVMDALSDSQITLAKASSYLDNLKIKDLRRLEETHVHI